MPYKLNIHHIDVGQGDATLIILKNDNVIEKAILIDAGGSPRKKTSQLMGLRVAKYCWQKLREIKNVRASKLLDAIIVSHFDSDHIGGIRYSEAGCKLWNSMLSPKTMIFTPIESNEKKNILDQFVQQHKLNVNVIEQPNVELFEILGLKHDRIKMNCLAANFLVNDGSGTFTEVKGSKEDGTYENRISLAFLINFFGYRYYTGGDIGASQEKQFSNYINYLNAFKVSHHAASTSTPAVFVDKCTDHTCCVVSYGKNSYKHPNDEVIDRLLVEKRLKKIYFTGQLDEYLLNGMLQIPSKEYGVVSIGDDELYVEKKLKLAESKEYQMVAPGVVSVKVTEGEDIYSVDYDRFDKEMECYKKVNIWECPRDESYPRNGLFEMFLMIIQNDLKSPNGDSVLALKLSNDVIDAVNGNVINNVEELYVFISTHQIMKCWEPDIQNLAALRCQARLNQLFNIFTFERKSRGAYQFGGKISYINKMTDLYEINIPMD